MQISAIVAIIAVSVADATTTHPFVEQNFDFVGNDVGNAPGSAVDKCNELCEANAQCKAYTWSGYNNGTCWLKSKRDQVVAKWGVVSSVMWEQQPTICKLLDGVDFEGNDVGSVPSPQVEQCCYICSKTFNCRAYSWTNYNSGTCWLKSSRGVAVKKDGVKSADLYPNDAPLRLVQYDTDFVGHDITSRLGSSPSACFDLCKSVDGCKAFSWSNYARGTCWLKDDKEQEVPKTGVVSGMMQ